jgi:hypothetical protein
MTITRIKKEFTRFPELPDAILQLAPECGFSISMKPETQDYDWGSLMWGGENSLPAPTEEEARNKLKELIQEWELEKYKYDRFMAYPTIETQLAMLYDDIKSGTPIEEGDWFKSIQKVKEDIPKS